MNRSEDIKDLALALSAAQGVLENVKKTTENPFFKKMYSDLASCWDTIREPLSNNKLSIIQTTDPDDTHVIVETTLLHGSGQWVSGTIKMTPVKRDPQGFGSAMTYARRYGLMAIIGLAPEEDDGNDACKPQKGNGNKTPSSKHPAKEKKKEITAEYLESYIDEHIKTNQSPEKLEEGWALNVEPILANYTEAQQNNLHSVYNDTLALLKENKA
jgi:hypothetical protein